MTRELIALPGGALLIDTPGLREVGLWSGAGGSFADIDELAADCRFAGRARPRPAPRSRARSRGGSRIAAWRKLAREQAWLEDRKAAARERARRGRRYHAVHREARRRKGDV